MSKIPIDEKRVETHFITLESTDSSCLHEQRARTFGKQKEESIKTTLRDETLFSCRRSQTRLVVFFLPPIVLNDYSNGMYGSCHPSSSIAWHPTQISFFSGQYLWEDVAGWIPEIWKGVENKQDWLIQRFCSPETKTL